MRAMRILVTSLMLGAVSAWAGGTFAGDECVQCGGEGAALHENRDVTKLQVRLFCQSIEAGKFATARNLGVRFYDSLEGYYNRFDQIDCSGAYRNPVILGVEQNILEGELITELEKIEEHMDEEMIDYIINMPSREGDISRNVMDIASLKYEVATESNNEDAERLIKMVLVRLERLGAKELDDLSPEQRSRYSGLK